MQKNCDGHHQKSLKWPCTLGYGSTESHIYSKGWWMVSYHVTNTSLTSQYKMFSARQTRLLFVIVSYTIFLMCAWRLAECRTWASGASTDTCERDVVGAVFIIVILQFIDIVFMPPVMSIAMHFSIQ